MVSRSIDGRLWFTGMVRYLGRLDDWVLLLTTICVTGPRDLPEEKFYAVEDILDDWLWKEPNAQGIDFLGNARGIDFLGVGDARGVDDAVSNWASWQLQEEQWEIFRADWDRFGKGAGPIRNREMLQRVNPDALLAILVPGLLCRGTWDCIEAAMELDIRIYPYRISL